jgi:hypothetical protein
MMINRKFYIQNNQSNEQPSAPRISYATASLLIRNVQQPERGVAQQKKTREAASLKLVLERKRYTKQIKKKKWK